MVKKNYATLWIFIFINNRKEKEKMNANVTTTRITVNGKLQHYSIDQIFDKKYTKLEFTTFSFSAKLINHLSEYMSLQGVIGSHTNLSLANNPNFLYALNRVHTKVMLLSNEQGDLRVITGSANLSLRALDENSSQGENIVIVDNDKQLFNQWHDYFNQLWNIAKETKQPTLGKYIKPKKALTPSQLQRYIETLDSKIDTLKKREQLHKKQITKLKELKSIDEINKLKSDNKLLKNKLQELNLQNINSTLQPLVTGTYKEKEQLLDALIGFDSLDKQIKKTKHQYYSTKKSKHLTIDIVNTQLNHALRIQRNLFMLREQMKSPVYDFCPDYKKQKSDYIDTKIASVTHIIAKYTSLMYDMKIAMLRNELGAPMGDLNTQSKNANVRNQTNSNSNSQKKIVSTCDNKETSEPKANILIRFWTHIKTVMPLNIV